MPVRYFGTGFGSKYLSTISIILIANPLSFSPWECLSTILFNYRFITIFYLLVISDFRDMADGVSAKVIYK